MVDSSLENLYVDMGLNSRLSFNIKLTECFLFMCVISAFTLFPNNVLPVMSSLLMLKESPLEDLEYSMDGLESFTVQAIEQRIIILYLKNGFSHKKDKIKKITIIANFLKTEALCTMDLKEAR